MVRGRKAGAPDPKGDIHIMISKPELVKQLVEERKHRQKRIGCDLTWAQVLESMLNELRENTIPLQREGED